VDLVDALIACLVGSLWRGPRIGWKSPAELSACGLLCGDAISTPLRNAASRVLILRHDYAGHSKINYALASTTSRSTAPRSSSSCARALRSRSAYLLRTSSILSRSARNGCPRPADDQCDVRALVGVVRTVCGASGVGASEEDHRCRLRRELSLARPAALRPAVDRPFQRTVCCDLRRSASTGRSLSTHQNVRTRRPVTGSWWRG
jgi:hypothetical protein